MIGIGHLAMPVTPLILFAALIVSLFVGKRLAAAHRKEIDSALYGVMLAGLLAARAAFVIRYWDKYRQSPLGVFDIRDGGFLPWAGLAVAGAVAVAYVWRSDVPRRALLWSLSAGVAVAALGGTTTWMLRRPYTDIALPAQSFLSLEGQPVRLDAFRGKPVVVNLWASWCPPCRHEMPVLQQAQAKQQDIVFVFADQGETAAAARDYLAAQHIDIANVVLDPQRDLAKYVNSKGLPTTLFFDRSGRLADMRIGELSEASLASHLATIRPDSNR
jgi:thiol-disulfide isomerase/thioredoxin